MIPAKIALTRHGVAAAIREYLERRGVVVGVIEFPWLGAPGGDSPDPTVATVATDLDETWARLEGRRVLPGEAPPSEGPTAAYEAATLAARKAGGSAP